VTALKPVIVLRSNDTCALGVVRSLGVAGHDVVLVGFNYEGNPLWTSNESIYCTEFLEISNPARDPLAATTRLKEIVRAVGERYGEEPALVATSDTSIALIEMLGPLTGLAITMNSALYSENEYDLNDKFVQSAVLSKSGFSTPGFASLDELDEKLDDGRLKLPIIIKPRKKGIQQSFYSRNGGLKGLKYSTRAELMRSHELRSHGSELIFQSFVEDGPEPEICAYVSRRESDGSMLTMSVKKDFVTPRPFGTASVVSSVAMHNLELEASRLADRLRWNGVLMVEFKFDVIDLKWKCLEVNFRPWLLVDFPRRHGLNFLSHWLSTNGESGTSIHPHSLAAGLSHISLRYLKIAFSERGVPFTTSSIVGMIGALSNPVTIAEWDLADQELSRRSLAQLGLEELINHPAIGVLNS